MYIFPCLLKFGTFYSSESKIFFAIELCKSLAFRENDHLHMFDANWLSLLVPRKDCQVGWHRCFCAISRRTNHTNRWHLFSFIWAGRWCFCFQLLRIFPVHLITVWQRWRCFQFCSSWHQVKNYIPVFCFVRIITCCVFVFVSLFSGFFCR